MIRTAVCAMLAVATMAIAAPSHNSMGPVYGFTPEPVSDARTISFSGGWVIDTRAGEPMLPAELRLDAADPDAVYWIVQFEGPVRRAWQSELERLGAEPFGYLPQYAVLCRLNATQRAAVAALPYVTWTGIYQPAYKLEPGLTDAAGLVRLVVLLMPDADITATSNAVTALGGTVDFAQTTSYGKTIELTVAAGSIPALARRSDVFWMQRWSEPGVCNNNVQWVVQGGWRSTAPSDTSMAARSVWQNGVRGQGIILSTTDTGLNLGHDMFRDPALPVTAPGIWPAHRKVVAFKLMQGPSGTADPGENPYHGSHVNGTVAGNDSATGGTSYYDGMSKDARLYFVDLTTAGGSFVIGTDFTSLWDTVYSGRGLPDSLRPIKQQSGSWRWGNSSGTYLIQDACTDAFIWAHKDFMNIMAAGNEYSARTIGNPGIAKNVLTVGATQNGTSSNVIADFSSRGPTQDNRTKPNIMAPGDGIYSAENTGSNGYQSMSGTSMATPGVNGTIGLLRCYLAQGYYPTGAPVPADRFGYISSALLRSMAMVSGDPNIGAYVIPSYDIGWGRIDAESVLYFPGNTRRLMLVDDTLGVATGEFKELEFRVTASIPLRVCLAWSDTAAAPSANPVLVNDLNLRLVAPNGTEYRGNKYTSGQSTANPTTWDNVNVEECARVNAPDTGIWHIRVSGQNVATAANQPFAWTITGAVQPAALVHDASVTALVAPVGQVDSGTVITPRSVIANNGTGPETFDVEFTIGAYCDTQPVTLAAGIADTVNFTPLNANVVGWFQASCRTLLAADENPANDMLADSFQVVPQTGIEGGGDLPRVYSLDRPQPTLFNGRTTIRFAVPHSAEALVAVYSVDGSLIRTLACGVQKPGRYAVTWDGTDDNGRKVGRGIYYCRMAAPGFSGTEKLVRVR